MRIWLVLALLVSPAAAARQVRTPLGNVLRLGTIHASPLFQFPDGGRREAMLASGAFLDAARAGKVPGLAPARLEAVQALHLAPALNYLSWKEPARYRDMVRRLMVLDQLGAADAAEAFASMREALAGEAPQLAREAAAFLDHTVRDPKTPRSRAGLDEKLGEAQSVANEMAVLSVLYGEPLAELAREASARAGELRQRKLARFGDEQSSALSAARPVEEPVAADYEDFRLSKWSEERGVVQWIGELPARGKGRLPAAARVTFAPARGRAPARLTTQVYGLSEERAMTRDEAWHFTRYFSSQVRLLRAQERGADIGLAGRYGGVLSSMRAQLKPRRSPNRRPEALTLVRDAVLAWKGAGERPIVVVDLDDTAFDTGPRRLSVAHDFAKDPRLTWREARMFVGSSRVDLQACKLEYSIVSPK